MGGRSQAKRLLRYVERDKFRKADKLLSAHPECASLILDRSNGQNGLHIAAKMGHCDTLRILLKHGCDAKAQDRRKCLPLHHAAKRCLRHFSSALMSDLVSGLLAVSSALLDEPNAKGTTCRTLVDALEERRRLERSSSPSSLSSTSEEEEGDASWREKLEAEAEEDVADRFGRSSGVGGVDDYYSHAGEETFDEWADRIFAEYRRKRQTVFSNVVAPAKERREPEPARKKLKLPPKLVAPSLSDLYRKFCARVLGGDASIVICAKDIPFSPSLPGGEIVTAILDGISDGGGVDDESQAKRLIREEIRRWHPDKFAQRYRSRFAAGEEEQARIMKIVTHIAQSLIEYGRS